MKYLLLLWLILAACNQPLNSQEEATDKKVGGPCEGCEAIFEYGNQQLTSVDTLPAFESTEPKLKITGKVLKKDGKTPAADVVVYIYHTDREGIYPTLGDEKGWARRHGYIRGWIKTDKDGHYAFYTFRPASYPNRQAPEHIHITVKESGKTAYYLDDYLFEDDPLLTDPERKRQRNRGGSGIVQPTMENGILTVKRDLVLGLNIPDYE